MALNIVVSGEKTKRMVRVNSFMWTETFTMVSGQMIKQTALASTSMLTELCTKESGRMICSTVGELRPGLIRVAMRVITGLAANTGLVVIAGVMEASTQVTGVKIKSAGPESTRG